nr:ESX-1 secretion-associated protein EspI-like [Equus asinus]
MRPLSRRPQRPVFWLQPQGRAGTRRPWWDSQHAAPALAVPPPALDNTPHPTSALFLPKPRPRWPDVKQENRGLGRTFAVAAQLPRARHAEARSPGRRRGRCLQACITGGSPSSQRESGPTLGTKAGSGDQSAGKRGEDAFRSIQDSPAPPAAPDLSLQTEEGVSAVPVRRDKGDPARTEQLGAAVTPGGCPGPHCLARLPAPRGSAAGQRDSAPRRPCPPASLSSSSSSPRPPPFKGHAASKPRPRRRHLVVFPPGPCHPATWRVTAEAEAPPQLPARPVPAGRGAQTHGCPLVAGRRAPAAPAAAPWPALPAARPRGCGAGRPLRPRVQSGATRGRPSLHAVQTVSAVGLRRGAFGTRCFVFQDFPTGVPSLGSQVWGLRSAGTANASLVPGVGRPAPFSGPRVPVCPAFPHLPSGSTSLSRCIS